jgi:hypothetical protein
METMGYIPYHVAHKVLAQTSMYTVWDITCMTCSPTEWQGLFRPLNGNFALEKAGGLGCTHTQYMIVVCA